MRRWKLLRMFSSLRCQQTEHLRRELRKRSFRCQTKPLGSISQAHDLVIFRPDFEYDDISVLDMVDRDGPTPGQLPYRLTLLLLFLQ